MNLHKFNAFQNTLICYKVYYIFNDWLLGNTLLLIGFLGSTLSLIGCYVTHSQRQLMNSWLINTFAKIGFLNKKWYSTCINYDLWLNIMLSSRRTVSRYRDTYQCRLLTYRWPNNAMQRKQLQTKIKLLLIFFLLLLPSLSVEFNVKITHIKWSSTTH